MSSVAESCCNKNTMILKSKDIDTTSSVSNRCIDNVVKEDITTASKSKSPQTASVTNQSLSVHNNSNSCVVKPFLKPKSLDKGSIKEDIKVSN